MKLGVLTVPLYSMSLAATCEYLRSMGVQAVELGCGGYPGKTHADPDVLLKDEKKLQELKNTIQKNGLFISALGCHGNPVHPDKNIAQAADSDMRNAVLLAEKLNLDTIITFSGCPGGSPHDTTPNWVTCPWPEDFLKVLDYQWNEVLIPYWKGFTAFAKDHGVTKIALEAHPGFCVYNPETLLKLRAAVGPEIGANFDPSHFIWQGIDPVAAIKELQGAIFHFHAKDTKIDPYNTAVNGVLDTKHYSDVLTRSWVFRTVGYGLDASKWKEMVSALKATGYDYVMSIEHEDSLMSVKEGLEKAVRFLREIMIFESPTGMWWA